MPIGALSHAKEVDFDKALQADIIRLATDVRAREWLQSRYCTGVFNTVAFLCHV